MDDAGLQLKCIYRIKTTMMMMMMTTMMMMMDDDDDDDKGSADFIDRLTACLLDCLILLYELTWVLHGMV